MEIFYPPGVPKAAGGDHARLQGRLQGPAGGGQRRRSAPGGLPQGLRPGALDRGPQKYQSSTKVKWGKK